ncbi:MAG: hypothetical protein Q8Q60_04910 [Candidatus Chromulinivorax sp.]|nr:hypothetical protein [Candidatus Chromulinivorax sp.]
MRKIYFFIFLLLCHPVYPMMDYNTKTPSPIPRKNNVSSLHKNTVDNNLLATPQSKLPAAIQTQPPPRSYIQYSRDRCEHCGENINCSHSCSECTHACTKIIQEGCIDVVTENCTPICITVFSLCCTALCTAICCSNV